MPPATTALIAELALKYGPPTALAIAKLFEKETVTVADWEAIFNKVETTSYDDYVKGKTPPQP